MTEKQKKVLDFLTSFIAANGHSPSYEEIMQGAGINSKSAVHRYLNQLRKQGRIRKRDNCARSVEVVSGTALPLASHSTAELVAELERRGLLLRVQ